MRELFGEVRAGTHLEIRVADTGSGLTVEAQRQLFTEPFFSTKTRKRGFGLAMAYSILAAHRGGLELLRRPEGGTIARLVLPVLVGPASRRSVVLVGPASRRSSRLRKKTESSSLMTIQ